MDAAIAAAATVAAVLVLLLSSSYVLYQASSTSHDSDYYCSCSRWECGNEANQELHTKLSKELALREQVDYNTMAAGVAAAAVATASVVEMVVVKMV